MTMRRSMIGLCGVILTALAVSAWMQRRDLAAEIDAGLTLPPAYRANSASTGSAVDLANYQGAALVAVSGVADNAALASWLVLQDSAPGAWTAVDSVLADSVDNKYYELGYRGARRYVRAVLRATGSAADSILLGAVVLRSGRRSR